MALTEEVIDSVSVPRIGAYSHAVRVGDLERVVKLTCFVADPTGFVTLNTLFAEYFAVAPPVRSTPIVSLPRGLLFSVDAIAVATTLPPHHDRAT